MSSLKDRNTASSLAAPLPVTIGRPLPPTTMGPSASPRRPQRAVQAPLLSGREGVDPGSGQTSPSSPPALWIIGDGNRGTALRTTCAAPGLGSRDELVSASRAGQLDLSQPSLLVQPVHLGGHIEASPTGPTGRTPAPYTGMQNGTAMGAVDGYGGSSTMNDRHVSCSHGRDRTLGRRTRSFRQVRALFGAGPHPFRLAPDR